MTFRSGCQISSLHEEIGWSKPEYAYLQLSVELATDSGRRHKAVPKDQRALLEQGLGSTAEAEALPNPGIISMQPTSHVCSCKRSIADLEPMKLEWSVRGDAKCGDKLHLTEVTTNALGPVPAGLDAVRPEFVRVQDRLTWQNCREE